MAVRKKHPVDLWLIVLLLLVFWLGLRMLNVDILWFDENKTAFFTGARHYGPLSPLDVWQGLADNNPWQSPGYYILLNVWTRVVGWSDFAARSLSLYIGVLSLAFCYRIGCDLFSQQTGRYAAVALAGSSVYIHYLHEMRPYALYSLMTCLSVWAYWRITHRRGGLLSGIGLFVGLAGLAYTHVLALLTAFGIGVYHLLVADKNRRWIWTSLVMLLAALAFVPWMRIILQVPDLAETDDLRYQVSMFGFELVETLLVAFSNGNVALLLLLVSIALLSRKSALRFVLIWLSVALIIAMVISYVVPAFLHIRYLFSVWVAVALLVGLGIDQLQQRGVPSGIIPALWLALGILASSSTDFFATLPNSANTIPRDGFMQMIPLLEDFTDPDDLIVLHTAPPTVEWITDDTHAYYLHHVPANYTHMELIQPFPNEATDSAYQQAVEEVTADVPMIWTAIFPGVQYSRRRLAFQEQLERTHTKCQQVIDRPDMQLALYAQPGGEELARFGEDGAVQISALRELPQTADTRLDVFLGWNRQADVPPDTYSTGLHVYNLEGGLVTQVDSGLSNDPFSCQWLSVPVEFLSPGSYRLGLLVYDWRTGERLSVTDSESTVQIIGQMTIK